MDTIVLTTANSETPKSHEYSYKLTNAMHLDNHYICLSNLSIYYSWKNIKDSYDNNILGYKIRDNPIINIIFPDGSYSIKDINNYMHMIMIAKKSATADNYPISIYPNSVFNRVSIVVEPDCKLMLSEGMAHVLGFSNLEITSSSQGDLIPKLERVETVLVHCNIAQNSFTQDSSLIYSFVPDNTFGTLLHQRPSFPLWKQTRKNSEISEINITFTDQNYRSLEIEDNILVEIQLAPERFISKA